MHFDHLDEIYAMVKSILSFEQLDKTGLTGFWDRSDRSCTAVPILVVNICPPILWQSLRAKKHSSGPKLSKGDDE